MPISLPTEVIVDPSNSWELAKSQFLRIWEYGATSFEIAEKYINDLQGYIEPSIETTVPDINITAPGSIVIDPFLEQNIPAAPDISEYPDMPATPSTSEYPFPDEPVFTFPTPPVLTDIVIPDFIEENIAPMSESMPSIDFAVPSVGEIQPGALTYDSLMEAIKQRLLDNLADGGTMINPLVEADIWNRDRERRQQALQDSLDSVTAMWARLGWSVPDGLLAGSLNAVHKEYLDKDIDASREISIKQAEMEQAGISKTLELGYGVEQVIMTAENEYAKRVMEASRYTAEITIEIYKARVAQYNAMLEGFKADAAVYKTRIEAEIARADVFKTKISALQIISQIDESKIKIYASHIGAIQQLVDLYKTKIQAVATLYEAENQKILRFKAQIDAYVATVEGITKKYMTSVEGFKAYVTAWSTSAESQTRIKDLNMKGEIATLEATMKAWEVQVKMIHENTSLKLEALKTVAQTSSNLAAGALSAANSSAQTQFGSQNQYSESHQYSY